MHTYINICVYIYSYEYTHKCIKWERGYTMFANVLNIYTEYILASMNTKLRFNMTMLVVKVKNSHIQIILEEKLKIIVLAPFTEMIYKISDM